MPHRNRVVVIDDKPEDGEAIVRCLWRLQIPCYFLHYDEELLLSLDQDKSFEGIRFIFQDIALVSPDFPGSDDYAAAAAGIDRVLDKENGPWLMIAWSTWGDDPDQGDKYAKELYEYLAKHLSPGKRPYQYIVIDKRPYSVDGQHAVVKVNFTDKEKERLIDRVQEVTKPINSLEALSQWEANIKSSASKLIHDLWSMIESGTSDNTDKALGGILFQLAIAQEGTRLKKTDSISEPLYQILSSLLYDKISHISASEYIVSGDVKKCVANSSINTMLHWENVRNGLLYSPGSVYQWPLEKDVNLGGLCISENNYKEFLIEAFVSEDQNKRRDAMLDLNILEHVKLVLLDITPACDHANDKAFWRRFLVGIKVLEQAIGHFYTGKTKLAGDFLKDTPDFSDDHSKWRFIFNSKLVLSLTDNNEYITARPNDGKQTKQEYKPEVAKLVSIGRIREQMLQEFVSWYGRMATRPGIVSLR